MNALNPPNLGTHLLVGQAWSGEAPSMLHFTTREQNSIGSSGL